MPAMDNAYALIVGIAGYAYVAGLPEAVRNDARDVRDLLADPRHGGYPPGRVTLLLDEQATRAGILGALAGLAARSDAQSSVVIYISGHGAQVTSGAQAGEYILPVDCVPASAEDLAATAISGAEFAAALQAIPAGKVLVVFDCCHAGGIGRAKGGTASLVKAGLPDGYYERLAAGRGRAILSSSRDSELSYVLPAAANSLFTQHLLAGLKGGVPGEDGLIRIFDLFEYVQPRVTRDHPGQHPVFRADLEENFPVALAPPGTITAAPKDEEGFRYDAYLSYVDRPPDSTWVWETLIPRLEREGLRLAVSGASSDPGVPLVMGIERGIRQAKRTLVMLSQAYLEDNRAEFENVLAQTLGIGEGAYRLLPVRMEAIDEALFPLRLSMLTTIDLADPARADREFTRLTAALRGPLPRR